MSYSGAMNQVWTSERAGSRSIALGPFPITLTAHTRSRLASYRAFPPVQYHIQRPSSRLGFVILFGIGIAIGSSNVRHSFRPRQRLRLRFRCRCRCRMRHTGVGYLVALGTPERLSLPGSHSQRPWVYFALRDLILRLAKTRADTISGAPGPPRPGLCLPCDAAASGGGFYS
jgi:hypothetical protein